MLSLLWLMGGLALVTVPAATAAMFEVNRLRGRGDDPPLVRSFLLAFRQYFRTGSMVGLGWAVIGGVLAADLLIVAGMTQPARGVLLVALGAGSLLYVLGSVALFPVLVSYHAGPLPLVRRAVLVALLFPGRSLLGLVAVASAAATVWFIPLMIIIAPGLASAAVQRLYQGAFARLRARVSDPSPGRTVLTPAPVLTARSA